MKYLLITLLTFTISLFGENNINDIIVNEYKKENLSFRFDNYTDKIIQEYKNKTGYLKKLGASYGIGATKQAEEMIDKIFKQYYNDLDGFMNDILNEQKLYNEIKNNYNEYITDGSNIIENETNQDFKNKFLDIYNSNTLKIMLNEDIKEKISQAEQKILDKLKDNVSGNQLTAADMIIGAIVIHIVREISKIIAKKIGFRIANRMASRAFAAVPLIGWIAVSVMTAYDLANVNAIYDDIGKEIKTEFHQNETLILSKISNEFADLNNISSNYKQDIADITFDFIKKAKPIYLSTDNNLELRNKILNSDNYTYIKFSETFYQIPIEYYNYLANKFLSLSLREMEYFHTNISQLNDIYIFDNIKYFENKYKVNIGIDNFFKLTKLFNYFNTQNEIDTYFMFTQKLFTINNLTNNKFLLSLSAYDVIKNETSLFQNKYIAILKTSKNIKKFNKFLSEHIKEIKEFDNNDISLLNNISIEDKQELILNPIFYKYKIYILIFIILIILIILIFILNLKRKQQKQFIDFEKYKLSSKNSNINKLKKG